MPTRNTDGRPVVYDLTEVLLASTGKLRYYGIVRVVAEIARSLRLQDQTIKFGVFSWGHGAFFEVFPMVEHDVVDLNVPTGVKQTRVRSRHYKPNPLRDLVLAPIRSIAKRRARRAWETGCPDLRRLHMSNTILVSCGRPKLIVEQILALDGDRVPYGFIPLLHDMIPLHDHFDHKRKGFPTNFVGDNQTIISRADLVVANSEFTRSEILNFSEKGVLPKPAEVSVVQLVHECPAGSEAAEQMPPSDPYILAVGATLGRKNLDVVLDAMLRLKSRGAQVPKLVLAGATRKHIVSHLEAEAFAPIRQLVEFRTNPNQTDLVELYRNALALVIPSRMEGWGLPAGEALWLGTPVICSTAPVFREVCGDLGLYFDPDDAKALVDILVQLQSSPSFVADLRRRISDAKPSFRTWDVVASDLLRAISDMRTLSKAEPR